MAKIKSGNHEFEIIEYVPKGYVIWNIGANMIDGYLPICDADENHNDNVETFKAFKFDGAQTILSAVSRGHKTIEEMERYIKRYANSKGIVTQRHVEKLKKALPIMKKIKWC